MRRYRVTWRHILGGANTEFTYASDETVAIKNVMAKYSMDYVFYSVCIY
jgi:hypothetical protein